MPYKFSFHGGCWTQDIHQSEKFLLFFIAGGKEVSFFELLRAKIIKHTKLDDDEKALMTQTNDSHLFQSPYPYVKIFAFHGGFGIAKQFHSFYFKIAEEGSHGDYINIRPFTIAKTGYFFNASGYFVMPAKIKTILDPECDSLQYIDRQSLLPLNILRKMVGVKKNTPRHEDVRQVRRMAARRR